MNDLLLEKVAYRELFCNLIELVNALHDSRDMISNLKSDEDYDEFTRGYISALDCSIKMIHSILDEYLDYEMGGHE